jgi:LysR family cyn operon transcriptional activator
MLLRHVRYVVVAEHKNFTRAAEALHVSQPTLSQQIRQLEDTLRTQLLDRSGRTVQLTDVGVAWVRYAKHHGKRTRALLLPTMSQFPSSV